MTITVTGEGPSFTDRVFAMREAQREYFKTRDPVILARAKRLEREIDKQLEVWRREQIWQAAREEQPELFIGGAK
jgi:hypothetical protein